MFEDADLIHRYTRADAIEDGTLVDVTATATEAGFRVPVALTRTVWVDCVEWSPEDSDPVALLTKNPWCELYSLSGVSVVAG